MPQQSSQITVVLADDEPILLNSLCEYLTELESPQFSIVGIAHGGMQALNLILDYMPDIAILDIRMPELTGLEVIQRVRQTKVTTQFILLSGYDDFSYAQEAIQLGVQSYLLKPFVKEELYQALKRISPTLVGTACHFTCYPDSSLDFLRDLVLCRNQAGRTIQNRLPDLNQKLNLELTYQDCFVMILSPEQAAPEPDKLLSMIQAMNDSLHSRSHVFWSNPPDQIIGIFNGTGLDAAESAALCRDTLRSKFGCNPYIAYGDTVSSLQQISYSYSRALTAMTYRFFTPEIRILSNEMICTAPPRLTIADIDIRPLVQGIFSKDYSSIRLFCEQFVENLMYVPMPPPNYVLGLCASLVSMMERELSVLGQPIYSAASHSVFSCTCLADTKTWLYNTFEKIAKSFSPAQDGAECTNSIIQTAQTYIRENVSKNLLLEDVAQQVHLSPSYFAIYYKKITDTNIRDFILKTKMEYAKTQLALEQVAVNDLAEALGYSDYRSFSRAFKKYYGFTPSRYRSGRGNKP